MATGAPARLLDPGSTAAVLLGASDWTEAGLGRAPSFRRSAKGVLNCLIGTGGLGLDPELVLDIFDDPMPAGNQLARVRDTLDGLLRERREAGRPVADLLVYYVGHGSTDEQGHLALLARRSRQGLEAETGIKAPDLARVLKVAAPQQRRLVVLDCCFAEAAARAFIGMGGALDQAVAATAAKDIAEALPGRGGLLLCSSPVGEVSVGPPKTERTLFTGAVLEVLRDGAAGRPERLSFADLRDAAHEWMVEGFGARAPRPVLHPVNQAQGDLSRLPAFPNRAAPPTAAEPQQLEPGASHHASPVPEGPSPQRPEAHRPARKQAVPTLASAPPAALTGPGTAAAEPPARSKPEQPLAGRHWSRSFGELAVATLFAAGLCGLVFVALPKGSFPVPELLIELLSPAIIVARADFLEHAGNLAEAARLYRLAADQGYAAAQFRLGFILLRGRGALAPRDEKRRITANPPGREPELRRGARIFRLSLRSWRSRTAARYQSSREPIPASGARR